MSIEGCSKQDIEEARRILLEVEAKLPMQEKKANGDASE
jgi:hypothetical protein